MPLSPAGLAQRGEKAAAAAAGPPQPQGGRLPSGGPAGRAPLVRALRAKQPDLRPVAREWLDRFARDQHSATAELLSLLLVVADVPLSPIIERDDLKDREPADVVQELVAALALEASEKGADFTQHWLVSRERGAARVRENFPHLWRDLASASPGQELLVSLAQTLRDWTLALSGCQFRSIRHAATVAGLHAVEGLSFHVARLREFCGAAPALGAGAAEGGACARRTSLALEMQQAQRCLEATQAARDALGMHLVSHRTKDIDPEIRRSCFEAVRLWARADPDTFLDSRWTRYLFLGLADRHPGARAPVLAALHEMFSGDPSSVSPKVRALAEDLRVRVLSCCHDVDPAVGAAAVRCATQLAARGLLAEESFDPIIDLVWDPAAQRRCEAATFISRFVFTEDILDHQASGAGAFAPAGRAGAGSALARRRITMLLQFVAEYAEGHLGLVDRLASALWRRASCIEDFEAMACLALQEGADAVAGDQHAALIHLADAVACLAFEDAVAAGRADGAAPHAQAVLDGAARALAPRVPQLLAACQADALTMARAASLCRHVLRHCAAAQPGAAGALAGLACGPAGHAAAEALRAAFLRQPDPDVLEHLAEALGHLLDLASEARPVVRELAGTLRGRFLELSRGLLPDAGGAAPAASAAAEGQQAPVQDALLSTATRLRILAKAFDVSLCDLSHFVASALRVLDGRAEALAKGERPAAGPQLAVTLMELVVLVLTRHAAALLQPDPLFHCVAHDPIDADQLRLCPTAAEDLSTVVAALLKADPNVLVRTAAFTVSLVLLTAWWNAAHFAGAVAGAIEAPPMLPLSGGLAAALCGHLGELLTEASAVPADSCSFAGLAEPGDPLRPSVISQLFTVIQRASAASAADGPRGANGEVAVCAIPNATRVQMAALACAVVGACRHHDVAGGTLHSLVLSQGLSPREDMQEVAWRLLGRLRREAHQQAGGPEALFGALLRAVRVVHQDAGAEVAKELSYRMLQHVGVGKLAPPLQSALVSSLKDGAAAALADGAPEGLLEALVPWVTKNVVEDIFLRELVAWLERELGALGGGAAEQQERAAWAGVPAFLEACRATAGRGQQRRAEAPEPPRPQAQLAAELCEPGPASPSPARGERAAAGSVSPAPRAAGALPCQPAELPRALAPGVAQKRPRLE